MIKISEVRFVTVLILIWVSGLAQAAVVTTLEVTANPLWTNTGIDVSINDFLSINPNQNDIWRGGGIDVGPSGTAINTWDLFTSVSLHSSMIAYVGEDPYQGRWGDSTFFPQESGYIGVNNGVSFVSTESGRLWLGINDDAVSRGYSDNWGSITTSISVNPVPIPAPIILFSSGVIGMLVLRSRK